MILCKIDLDIHILKNVYMLKIANLKAKLNLSKSKIHLFEGDVQSHCDISLNGKHVKVVNELGYRI